MKTMRWHVVCVVEFFLLLSITLIPTVGSTVARADGGSVGVCVYETLEGYHQSMGLAGSVLADDLRARFGKVMIYDSIPLQSNESVRILDEMTEGREIVLSPVMTVLNGTTLAQPAITMSDDAIKFRDLTWHVNQDSVLALAKTRGHSHVLIGRIEGRSHQTQQGSQGDSPTISVQATATLRLINVTDGTTE